MSNQIFKTNLSSLKVENNFLIKEDADKLYNSILSNSSLYPLQVNPKGTAYGKEIIFHRSIGFFSDTSKGYSYSRQIAKSNPLPQECKELLEKVNKQFKTNYNGILINVYTSGLDYISAHSDDEKELDNSKSVIAISLGEERLFRIRPKEETLMIETNIPKNKKCKTPVYDITTEHGQLIAMCGDFQKEFTHEIPIEKTKKQIRISLTFRTHSK